MGDDLRLSKRRSGKRRKLRTDVAEHYEAAFRTLIKGVKPPPVEVDLPPGVTLRSRTVRKRRKAPPLAEVQDDVLVRHGRELLVAAAEFFRAEQAVRICVRCRAKRAHIAGETARLHHVLEKILGDAAPPVRPTAV